MDNIENIDYHSMHLGHQNLCITFDQNIFNFLYFTLLFLTQLYFLHSANRPFPSCNLPLCQNESKCETIPPYDLHLPINFMIIKLIFSAERTIGMVLGFTVLKFQGTMAIICKP